VQKLLKVRFYYLSIEVDAKTNENTRKTEEKDGRKEIIK